MKVIQIKLWDGSKYYIKDPTFDKVRRFFKNARRYFTEHPGLDRSVLQEIREIELTEQEYQEIPATSHSAKLFKGG